MNIALFTIKRLNDDHPKHVPKGSEPVVPFFHASPKLAEITQRGKPVSSLVKFLSNHIRKKVKNALKTLCHGKSAIPQSALVEPLLEKNAASKSIRP